MCLDVVALYGLLLMPMGAVIFADYWLLPRLGMQQDYAALRPLTLSWPAAAAWLLTLGACLALNQTWGVEIFFLGLPGWFIATGLYLVCCRWQQRRLPGALA